MSGLAMEITLFLLLLVQLTLLGMGDRGFWNNLFIPVTYIGYAIALILGGVFWRAETNNLFYGSLRNEALFQPTRLLFILVGLVLIRMLLVSKEIADARKKEITILFTANALLGCGLILSQSLLLSFMLLSATGLLSSMLVGISFYNRAEFEGAQKNWSFVIAAICFGFGALSVLAMIAGGLDYQSLRVMFAQDNGAYDFAAITLCLIPFFWVGGIFPFHFFAVDRDQASRWPIQAHLGIQVVGCVVLGLVHLLITVFHASPTGVIPSGLSLVSYLGLAGAIWGSLAAFSQSDAKRQWAYSSLALWSLLLVSVGTPSPLGLASGIFWASTIILGQTLVVSIMGRLSERAETSDLIAISKLNHPRVEIGFLLFGLTCLQALPPLPGFISLLHLLAAGSERGSLVFLVLICAVFLLFLLSALRTYVSFTRQLLDSLDAPVARVQSRMRLLDYSLGAAIVVLLLMLGTGWDSFFSELMRQAKVFIIS